LALLVRPGGIARLERRRCNARGTGPSASQWACCVFKYFFLRCRYEPFAGNEIFREPPERRMQRSRRLQAAEDRRKGTEKSIARSSASLLRVRVEDEV
jgi:hypothetical protein